MTNIIPLNTAVVTAAGAEVELLPEAPLSGTGFDYRVSSAPALLMNIFVTGASAVYIQARGSEATSDGRYVASGSTAQYGPFRWADRPQLYFAGAGTASVSYDVVDNER